MKAVKKNLTQKQLARAFRSTFAGEGGALVLAYLRAVCTNPPDYSGDRDGIAMGLHAAFLDGQRELIRKIERLMEQDESADAPAEEDTDG